MSRAGKSQSRVIIKESRGLRIVEQSRVRLLCVGFFFVLCFFSISAKMIEVAVIRNPQAISLSIFDPESEEKAQEVQIKSAEPVLQRGDIVDRNGVLLATSLMTASVFVNPREITNPAEAAQKVASVLAMDEKLLFKRMSSNKSFVWVKRNLSPKEQQAINSLGIPGLYFLPEERRVYPYGGLLSHMLGYVGLDNKGLAGVEQQFNSRLRDDVLNREPLVLSVDVRLQSMMREEMKKAVEEFQAIGATGIVMDISSGELLSMVSLPDFDPHKPAKATDAQKFNRASLGTYEMGSTFKSFTMAMGMDYGVTSMKGGYDATHPLRISSFTISDNHPKQRWLSVPEIFAYSSNIGTAKMALDVGGKRQREFLDKLGMLKPVDIELPERVSPMFPKEWRDINTVTISYGHGISVTPLHLVKGIAAMVNGGVLPRLTLLREGNKEKTDGQRVISEKTSKDMARLLRLVVEHGTGSKADVVGYRVGGKTGTAEKISAGGSYNDNSKMALFVSTFPVDSPKYVVLVMVDEPKGNKSTFGYATGGWIAAPVAGRVITRMGPMLGMTPRFDVPEDDAERYWTNNDKTEKPKPRIASAPGLEQRYLRAASY
jgi:cell division protein FtsI (penicillin-binding protein 3)